MINTDAKLTAHPDVLFAQLKNGNAVLLHLGTKSYFSLNPTGAIMWQGIAQGKTLAEVSQDLTQKFDVTSDRAASSVLQLADQLVGTELMRVEGA